MEEIEDPFIDIPDSETTCQTCYAEFLDPEDLLIHVQQVHSASKHCQLCPQPYTDVCDYAIHIRDVHLCQLKYCNFCTKVFIKQSEYKKHVKKHTCKGDSKKFSCSQCSETFTNTAQLASHEYIHHMNSVDGVFLKDYLNELSSVLNVKATTFLIALSNKSSVKCAICNYSTNNVFSYITHLQKNKCRSYVCELCSSVFKTKSKLVKHVTKHKQSKNLMKRKILTKSCKRCNKEIHSLYYKQHTRTCKPIQCTTCSMIFDTLPELSEHQSTAHPSSLELRTCKFCNRECVGEDVLKKHIERIHKSQFSLYKYLCVYCNTPFKHPKKLFGHFFTRHKDINPYTCKICDATFRIRKRFTIHIKLVHESKGFVEFDKNYNVFFTETKSENPFQPRSVMADDKIHDEDTDITDAEKATKEQNKDVNLVNVNSDFMDPTETEAEQEDLKKKNVTRKRKLTKNKPKTEDIEVLSSSDDDRPLHKTLQPKKMKTSSRNVKKYSKSSLSKKKSNLRKLLTCKHCNKYCYTFQNFNNHMSLHSKHEVKRCIKCLKEFNSKVDLETHIAKEHSTSKLTETLKTLLQKRKTASHNDSVQELTMSQKFQMTVRKVIPDENVVPAKVSVVQENGLSVQKFIENFTPEAESSKTVTINSSVTVKPVNGQFERAPVIKLEKFKPKPSPSFSKLAMPVRFKETPSEKTQINIRLVTHAKFKPVIREESNFIDNDNDYDSQPDRSDSIPDVAQEVMLATDNIQSSHSLPKIVIPKLPAGYKNVHIAHLMPEAPFYKIVKVEEPVNQPEKPKETAVNLPDGTKLVTVNPLAHLLGDKPVAELLQPLKNKYYQPKQVNFERAVANAMKKLEKSTKKERKVRAKKEARSMPILPVEQ